MHVKTSKKKQKCWQFWSSVFAEQDAEYKYCVYVVSTVQNKCRHPSFRDTKIGRNSVILQA